MSNSEDVTALFRRFGGSADSYQEIVSRDQAGAAEQKWPMLNQIRPMGHREAPSVRGGSPSHGPERVKQEYVEPYRAPVQHLPEVAKPPELAPAMPAVVLQPVAAVSKVVMVPPFEPPVMPAVAPQSVAEVVEAPPAAVVESVPVAVPPVSLSSDGGLKSLFVRMAAAQPSKAAEAEANPLKRLIKW